MRRCIFIIIFGGLAILVRFRTVDPLALRPRFSPGLPLSNDGADDPCKKNGKPGFNIQARVNNSKKLHCLRRPGNPGPFPDGRPVGFASPAFAGFAFIGFLLLTTIVYGVFVIRGYTVLLALCYEIKMPGDQRSPGISYLSGSVVLKQ
jgi:hypothetical protein